MKKQTESLRFKKAVTKYGFGRLLRAGLECTILSDTPVGNSVVIRINGNIWHGSINDLEII